MSDLDVLIGQMVSEIGRQAFQLEDCRLRLFLYWLMDHSSEMKVSLGTFTPGLGGADRQDRFQAALKTWLQSLPPQGLLWEFKTIIGEIDWCRDLDLVRLKRIVRSEVEQ